MIFFGMPTIWGCVKYRKLGYSSNGKDADKPGDSSNGYPTFRQTQYSLEKDESTRMCDGGGWLDRGASDSCEDPKVVFVLADPPAKVANTTGSLHDIRAYMHFWADFWI